MNTQVAICRWPLAARIFTACDLLVYLADCTIHQMRAQQFDIVQRAMLHCTIQYPKHSLRGSLTPDRRSLEKID
jgi:hypothetical protein